MKLSRKLAIAILALVGCASGALAVGNPPLQNGGFATIDQTWLNGLAGGQNNNSLSGVAAAGSNQATATPLSAGNALVEIDSGTGGFNLPPCFAGTELWVLNNSGATLTAYPAVANNPVTGAQDTINGSTSKGSLSTVTPYFFACAKNGVWISK
jgi:hypothetical protein